MKDSKKNKDKKPAKPKAVLGDHKRVGKKFIPPMAQLGLTDVRWSSRSPQSSFGSLCCKIISASQEAPRSRASSLKRLTRVIHRSVGVAP